MKFSIITVSYNSERTIERTIRSVLSQTYADYEYVVVDGASKDKTMNIVREYEAEFKGKMRWVCEPDEGIYDAMNKGIKMAKGEIIGIVNSDDWLEPDALKIVNEYFRQNGNSTDAIYTGGMMFHCADGVLKPLMPNEKMLRRYALIGDVGGVRHPATFVPKHIYERYGMFDTRMKVSADADFLLRYYKMGGVFLCVNRILTNMSDGGASNTLTIDYIKKRMLPDRRILMSNLGYSLGRQHLNIALWLTKMYLKVALSRMGIYGVR